MPLKVYEYSERRSLGEFWDVKAEVHKAAVKMVLSDIVLISSEKHVLITKNPTQSVHVQKKFKADEMYLVPATSRVQISLKGSSDSIHVTDTLFEHDGKSYVAVLYPQLQFEAVNKETKLFAYWAVRTTYDQVNANCKFETKEAHVKTGRTNIKIEVPILQNTKDIAAGDELIVYVHKKMETTICKKRKADETSSSSAATSSTCTTSADSKGKKAKGKGKSKGKGKGMHGK